MLNKHSAVHITYIDLIWPGDYALFKKYSQWQQWALLDMNISQKFIYKGERLCPQFIF
jgi:hypothetical protein